MPNGQSGDDMPTNLPPLEPLLALNPNAIFALYVAVNAVLLLILSVLTVRARIATGTTLGDGGKPRMLQTTRAFGNASEYIPIGLIMLYALVVVGAPTWLLHVQGATLTLGRVFHALGLHAVAGRSTGRVLGMLLTWASLLIGIVGAVSVAAGIGVPI